MAKNNQYINIRRDFEKIKESVIPAIYATISMVLSEDGVPDEAIVDICARSQQYWEQYSGNPLDMLALVYNRTGITFMTDKQRREAIKRGLIEEEQENV